MKTVLLNLVFFPLAANQINASLKYFFLRYDFGKPFYC